MEKKFISHSNSQRLILFFLGWGMDANPLSGLHKNGYDILAINDYTGYNEKCDFSDLTTLISPYREVVVVAWSFGVRIAADFINKVTGKVPLTRTIAVNGTERHIDDIAGIPNTVFSGTLRHLTPLSVRKFQRRMFSSAVDFAAFQKCAPQRGFESLLDELKMFASLKIPIPARWDRAIVGDADAIFPFENQMRAWGNIPTDIIHDMPHFPTFQKIIDQYIIDKDLVAQRFSAAQHTYTANASPQRASAQKIWELTRNHLPEVTSRTHVLEVGAGEGILTHIYLPSLQKAQLTLWDIAQLPTIPLPASTRTERRDAETAICVTPDKSIDILLSSSTMQWFNSPAAFLRQAARVLRPGGIAAFSLFGPGTYKEIAQATGSTLRYPTTAQLTAAASESLSVLECVEETTQTFFSDIPDVLRHIRHTGVNAISRNIAGATSAVRLLRRYPLAPDGTAPLSYHTIFMVLKKTIDEDTNNTEYNA